MNCSTQAATGALIVLSISLGPTAVADSFEVDWWTADGGGEMWSAGGTFELAGTIGQPDAQAPAVMTGGDFELVGGFWPVILPVPGDTNCDGSIDFDDINPFVAALVGREGYGYQYPWCNWLNGDIDGNGSVDFDDINPFVACLVAGRCP